MRILAFDCATARCSAAVWQDGAVRAHEAVDTAHGASEILVPMLERVLAAASLELRNVDRLAVTVGPGHFTGLRAGLAVARGLVLAAGMPAVAVTTLEAVAAGVAAEARDGRDLLVALDSKRAEPFLQLFGDRGVSGEPESRAPAEFAASLERGRRLLVAGDAAQPVIAAIRGAGGDALAADAPPRPDAAVVAAIAASRPPLDGALRPFYLHPPAVKLPVRPMPAEPAA